MFLIKNFFCPKIKTIHFFHCIFLTVSRNAMRKSVPRVECVFQHTLKMSPQSSKNCIHNHVTRHLSRPPIDICSLGVNLNRTLDLLLFEHPQVQHACTPIDYLKKLFNCHWLLLKTCVKIANMLCPTWAFHDRCRRTDCVAEWCGYLYLYL